MKRAPESSLDYVRWAREQARARGLTRGQAQLLNQLATHVDQRGECYPSVQTLAAGVVLSPRHTERLLGELGRLGLQQTERRGRGRTALRRLCPDAPVPAPPCPRGTMPLFDAQLAPTFDAPAPPAVAVPDPPSWTPDPPSDGGQKEPKEGEQQQQLRPRAPATGPLSPSLPAVLEILALAPDLVVEDGPVDIALRAFPAADHVQAAYRVVTLALEDGLEHKSASRQIWRALERQLTAPRGAPHGGRRRPAVPRPTSPAGRRWGPVDNKYDRAAGLL